MSGETPVRTRRRWLTALGVCGIAAVGAVVVTIVLQPASPSSGAAAASGKPISATAPVLRTTLREVVTAQGTLTYAGKRQLAAGLSGTITALPPAGTAVAAGSALYSIDNAPVVLLHGSLPAWRDLTLGIPDGPDVAQLESALAALGYFSRSPDARFDSATRAAIDRWQKAVGIPVTGSVPLGRVLFAPEGLRIAQDLVQIGDPVGAGTPVMAISASQKIVAAQVKAANQAVAVVGSAVTVHLPANTEARGTVASVEAPTEIDVADTKTVIVPVTVALVDPAETGTLQEVSVSVDFPTETRADVLAVPVGALIARPGGGFGVEVVRANRATRLVAVKTGLFAGGVVEVTGAGLAADQRVVVPKI